MRKINLPISHEEPPKRAPHYSVRGVLLIAVIVTALCLLIGIHHYPLSLNGRGIIQALPTNSSCATAEDIPTIIISCGNGDTDAVAEMRPLITSIILLTSVPLRFVFITDDDGVIRIQRMFAELGRTKRRIIVQTVKLSLEWMEKWAAKTKLDMYVHHSGVFGMAKLALPWLLPDIKLGVVLDTDMVLLKDPALLWSEALQEEGPGFQKGWVYRMMLSEEMEKPSQMCSCVIAMRLQQARDERLYPRVVGNALKAFPSWFRMGVYKPLHGDQGVFFALWHQDHRIVGNLDATWNRDHCHKFNGIFDKGNTKNAAILHRNCYAEDHPKRKETNDGSPPFFDFYEAYPWRWLRAPEGQGCDVVVEGAY